MSENIMNLISTLPAVLISFGGKLLVALIIFYVGKWLAGVLANLLKKILIKSKLDESVSQFIGNLAYGVILIFVILAAIARLCAQTTSFIAILGAASLAIGMALQGTLGNFSSGVMLMIFKPFRIGDYVIAGGVEGVVQDIGIFQTTIIPTDGRKVIVPNGALSGSTITNISSLPTRKILLSIGVPGNTDIGTMRAILQAVLDSEELVLKDPAASIIISAADAGAISFAISASVKNENYGKAHANLLEKIKLTLTEKGIWA